MDNLEREARERKKKVMALASLPLSVGFFVWRLQDNTSAAPPPPPPPDPIVQKAAPEVQKAAGAVLTLEKEKQKVVVVTVSGKDPFRPAFSILPPVERPAAAPQPVKTRITELLPTRMPMPLPPLRPFEPEPAMPTMTGIPPVRPTLEPAQPIGPVEPTRPAMPYVLTGIVKGNPDIAILRHWDGSRRIARVGDGLDKTYRLTMIEESFVMVSGDGDAISLRLGGDVRPTVAPEDKK